MTRILTISDRIDIPTGMGGQHRLMADAIHEAGVGETIALNLFGKEPLETQPSGLQTLGCGRDGLRDLQAKWGEIERMLRPDVVVAWGDMYMFSTLVADRGANGKVEAWRKQGGFHWLHWYPVDTASFEYDYQGMMQVIDHIVPTTLFGLNVLRPHLPAKRFSVIPCGVDHRTFVPASPTRKRRLRREWSTAFDRPMDLRDRRVLVYVDTNQWRKNPYVVVRCLRNLPDDVVLIMHCSPLARGGSNGWDLPAVAKRYGVYDRILWTGDVDRAWRPELTRERLAELYQLADLRISASQSEGFGLPSVEAGACGVPTVITDCTTNREVLAGEARCLARVGHWGVQPEGNLDRAHVDESDFTDKIAWLLDHEATRQAIGLRLRAHVEANYTIPKVKVAWQKVITATVGAL